MNRTGALVALGSVGLQAAAGSSSPRPKRPARIRVKSARSEFEREQLYPYHFKGSAITNCWQVAACLESESGVRMTGLGTQSVLWSDERVFAEHSESAGNALMYAMSERGLQILQGQTFSNPVDLLDELFPEVLEYGKKITGHPDLRKTFALNALVCVDNAAWLLYARENGLKSFDEMIPEAYRPGLSHRHGKVASIPSFAVGTSVEKIKAAADEGYFIMKLKMGSAGTQQEMLEKDKAFLTAVHAAIGHYETPHSSDGKIPYYFDANGRYEQKETLLRFLDHARKIGAFDQLAVIEEPFPESNEEYVGDVGVRVAADESAHTVEDAARRIELGYTAFAVKAIAKTMSMTMKIVQLAYEKNIPCFCADLTVNPILVDWNKTVAARLAPFPGITTGLQEANGHQYYKDWNRLLSYLPDPGAAWVTPKDGVYTTGPAFFEQSGGILTSPAHYQALFD